MPLVSVIIPTYNRADLVLRAVNSVLSQTFTDYECIVVDDASTDGTDHLAIFKSPQPPLKYVRFDARGGVSKARNAGVAASSGQWIAFLDSDDEWLPPKLEKQVLWHREHPAFEISQTKEFWVRRGNRVNPPKTHEKTEGYIFKQSLLRCMVTPSSVMLTRALFLDAGGFDESLPACEDYDLWLKITCRLPVGLVDEYLLTRYGGHSDQLSATTMALDRFRIQSIRNLLDSDTLSSDQSGLARLELAKKAAIVANGYKKRGNREEYERYAHIEKTYSDRA